METRHLDGDRQNSRLSNLKYGTHSENVLDSTQHGTNHWASKTHCPHGHEYTPENTYLATDRRHRHCRACWRAKNAREAANNAAKRISAT